MIDESLTGDPDGRRMAAPLTAGLALGRLIPPGPVLELCCGLGGLTRGLAQDHPVLALDRSLARLAWARANLAVSAPAHPVRFLACDLTRPALRPPTSPSFSAVVMDPDWSPAGAPVWRWAPRPGQMRPPADALAAWASAFAPRLVLRLPRDFPAHDWPTPGPTRRTPVIIGDAVDFIFLFLGRWSALPAELHC